MVRFDLLERRQEMYDRLGQLDARKADIQQMLTLAATTEDAERLTRARVYDYMAAIQRGESEALPDDDEEQLMVGLFDQGYSTLLLDLAELLVVRYWWGFSFPLDQARARRLQRVVLRLTKYLKDERRYALNLALQAELEENIPAGIDALYRTLALAEPMGDLRTLFLVHHRLGRFLTASDLEAALRHHLRSMEIARQMADTRWELIGTDNSAETSDFLGDYPQSVMLWQRCLLLQRQREQAEAEQVRAQNRYFRALIHTGALSEAERVIRDAIQQRDVVDEAALVGLLHIAMERNEWDEAERLLAEFAAVPQREDFLFALSCCQAQLFAAALARCRGDHQRAATLLADVREQIAPLEHHPQMRSVSLLTIHATEMLRLALDEDDPHTIERILAEVEGSEAGRSLMQWPLAELDVERARAHERMGNLAEAEAIRADARARLQRHAAYFSSDEARTRFLTAFAAHRFLMGEQA